MSFPTVEANTDAVQGRTCTIGIKSGSLQTVKRSPLE